MSGPIRISIIGDGGKAKKEFKDVASTAEHSFDKLASGLGKKVKESFSGASGEAKAGLGNLLGSLKGLPALGAGLALGGSLVAGFTKALDLEDARGKLQAQLGLTGPESAKAGKIAGDLYKQAYGDSISDVNDVLKDLFQTGLAGIGDSENKIEGIAQAAFTLSTVMGEETLPITRAVAQMLKTGLAKNAKEAFDILTRGQQLGINKSEDLLDTFNEYGTQFRKLGFSGQDALGLINQLLQGGARDADTAADAIKEFAIRAVDGSTTTVAGFKAIGLNADDMAKKIGAGGPTARKAFGEVLTALNTIKDPVAREAAGVALFGTKWEDLGGAVKNANLGTAAKSLGEVAGATSKAGDNMTTTKTKLSQLSRTIQQSLVEAIAKYALPSLNDFVSWFQGPGKFAIAAWAVGAGADVLSFLSKLVGGIGKTIPALASFASTLFYSAAAFFLLNNNVSQAAEFFARAKTMDAWSEGVQKNLGDASKALEGWSADLGKAKTRVEFEGNIEDLDLKITEARNLLKDPKLTATRRAKLEAQISQLERAKTTAVQQLGDPALTRTRTAQLTATKKQLDSQIAKAKAELASKDLTKERKATLNANISKLVAQRKAAQADLDKLHGVTVPVVISITEKIARRVSGPAGGHVPIEPRASGGPVIKGRTYWVGENGPELLTLGGMSGFITPTQKLAPSLLDSPAGVGSGAPVIVNVYALTSGPEVGRAAVEAIREYERFNGAGWRN